MSTTGDTAENDAESKNGSEGANGAAKSRTCFHGLLGEDVNLIAQSIEDWGCCTWCVPRFLGHYDPDIYNLEPEEVNAKYGLKGLPDGKVCITCLGILQFSNVDKIVEKIRKILTSKPREFNDLNTVMKLPIAIIPREHSLLVLLREKYPDAYCNVIRRDQIYSVKPIWKMRYAAHVAEALGVPCTQDSQFEVRIQFSGEDVDRECNFLKAACNVQSRKTSKRDDPSYVKIQHLHFNQNNVIKALNEIPDDRFKQYYQCPPKALPKPCEATAIELYHSSIYIAGRYNKYTRLFGQTPWFVDDEQKIESSVEESITPVLLDKIQCQDHKFMASGREDVDVRMLGRGRPFMIEFVNPRTVNITQADVTALQKKINASSDVVKVHHLQTVTKEEGAILKEGETEKTKNYSALIWCKHKIEKSKLDELSELKDLKLSQLTPIRVLHRRSHQVRERMVYSMRATKIDDNHFKIALSTQAGTYIKEFAHGDFGRTRPNLGELLGTECDILALDVEDVILDWPKPVPDEAI